MQDITEFLEQKKKLCEDRAERIEEQIEMFKRSFESNEKAYGEIAGYPNAIIPDEHGREQYRQVRQKQNELYAIADFIVELQEKYFN